MGLRTPLANKLPLNTSLRHVCIPYIKKAPKLFRKHEGYLKRDIYLHLSSQGPCTRYVSAQLPVGCERSGQGVSWKAVKQISQTQVVVRSRSAWIQRSRLGIFRRAGLVAESAAVIHAAWNLCHNRALWPFNAPEARAGGGQEGSTEPAQSILEVSSKCQWACAAPRLRIIRFGFHPEGASL